MAELNFSDIDTIKAFFMILLGSVLARILFYVYGLAIGPSIDSTVSRVPSGLFSVYGGGVGVAA